MTRQLSLALLIALCVLLLSPSAASAQTMPDDAQRILGSWELVDIMDDSGDRSADLDLYAFHFTFYPEEDDSLKIDFLIETGGDDGEDREPTTGTYALNQEADSLTIRLLDLVNISTAYVFENDDTMTLSVDGEAMNGVLQLVRLFIPGFTTPEAYAGTLVYTFVAANETDATSARRAGELPETSTLAQNYPNPFNPSTEIVYYLHESGPARLEAFDMAGKRIATLVDAVLPQGEHRARFDAGELPTGTYAYRLTVGGGAQTLIKTMTLVR